MITSSNVGAFQSLTTAQLITIVGAAIVFGAGVRLLNSIYLHLLWFDLEARRPVTDWLLTRGFGEVAARWRSSRNRQPAVRQHALTSLLHVDYS